MNTVNSTHGGTTTEAGTTYHRQIRGLIERNCIHCHDPGGIGPFELDAYQSVAAVAELSLSAIENGVMPPWQPDPACRNIKDDRIPSNADRQLFSDWVANGKPEGLQVSRAFHIGLPAGSRRPTTMRSSTNCNWRARWSTAPPYSSSSSAPAC